MCDLNITAAREQPRMALGNVFRVVPGVVPSPHWGGELWGWGCCMAYIPCLLKPQHRKDRTDRTPGTTDQNQGLTPFHRDGTWRRQPGTTEMLLQAMQNIGRPLRLNFATPCKRGGTMLILNRLTPNSPLAAVANILAW